MYKNNKHFCLTFIAILLQQKQFIYYCAAIFDIVRKFKSEL